MITPHNNEEYRATCTTFRDNCISFFEKIEYHASTSVVENFIYKNFFNRFLDEDEPIIVDRVREVSAFVIDPRRIQVANVRNRSIFSKIPIFIGEVILMIFYVFTVPLREHQIEKDREELDDYKSFWNDFISASEVDVDYAMTIQKNLNRVAVLTKENSKLFQIGNIERIVCLACSILFVASAIIGSIPLMAVCTVPIVISGLMLLAKRQSYIEDPQNFKKRQRLLTAFHADTLILKNARIDHIFKLISPN